MSLDVKNFINVGIKHLYHITSVENLGSILRNNLLSKGELKKNNIIHSDISYQGAQYIREDKHPRIVKNHIPLFFNFINPMLYAKKENHDSLLIIEFDISDLTLRNPVNFGKSFFTGKNLIYTDEEEHYYNSEALYYLPLTIFSEIGWQSINNENVFLQEAQCEFLFYKEIKSESIKKIYVNNFGLQSKVKELIKDFNLKLDIDVQIHNFQFSSGSRLDKTTLEEKYNNEIARLAKKYDELPEIIELRREEEELNKRRKEANRNNYLKTLSHEKLVQTVESYGLGANESKQLIEYIKVLRKEEDELNKRREEAWKREVEQRKEALRNDFLKTLSHEQLVQTVESYGLGANESKQLIEYIKVLRRQEDELNKRREEAYQRAERKRLNRERKIIEDKIFKENAVKHQNFVKLILKKIKLTETKKNKLRKKIISESLALYKKKYEQTNHRKIHRQEYIQKIQRKLYERYIISE